MNKRQNAVNERIFRAAAAARIGCYRSELTLRYLEFSRIKTAYERTEDRIRTLQEAIKSEQDSVK